MQSHDFLFWPSSAPTLPPSLPPLHLTAAGVEPFSSNPLKERKQKSKQGLDIWIGKGKHSGDKLRSRKLQQLSKWHLITLNVSHISAFSFDNFGGEFGSVHASNF